MRLWHYTAARFGPSIAREGLTKGTLVLHDRPVRYSTEWRWLTTSESWGQPCLMGTGRLPYARNEIRFAVDIPADQEHRVVVWTELGPKMTPMYDILSAYGDPENWRLWRGDIPMDWLSAIELNPSLRARAVLGRAGA